MIDLREHGIGAGSGLQEFFGDGSDGTIPLLSDTTTAPNGGIVANLWDLNAGTSFITGNLSSISSRILFEIDFGFSSYINRVLLRDAVLSAGTARTIQFWYSNDGVNWTYLSTGLTVSTSVATKDIVGINKTIRYIRLGLSSGGSDCTFTCTAAAINSDSVADVWIITIPVMAHSGIGIKQFTSLNLPAGYTITTDNPCRGLILYSQGDVDISGVIDMSQKAGLAPNGEIVPMLATKKACKIARDESLLHFDNNLTDAKGRVWTNNGSSAFDTVNKKFGVASISFSSTNQWLDTPASAGFNFGSDDFTIDFELKRDTTGNLHRLFGQCSSGITDEAVTGLIDTSNKVHFRQVVGQELVDVVSVTSIADTNWHHITMARKSGVSFICIDGAVDVFKQVYGAIHASESKFSIGRTGEYVGGNLNGCIDEFRIVKGKAIFPPIGGPTEAYTYQATYVDEPKTLEKYFQLITVLQALRGGYGGNGGYGGGNSGSYRSNGGNGGDGRQNLGGFGGGGGGGCSAGYSYYGGQFGGNILFAELGGGEGTRQTSQMYNNGVNANIYATAYTNEKATCGAGGAGSATGNLGAAGGSAAAGSGKAGKCNGGGGGGSGGAWEANSSAAGDGQYSGGFILVIVRGSITINVTGKIRANGGNGGSGSSGVVGTTGGGGGGGGAGGGVIALFYKHIYNNNGTIQVNAGSGGYGAVGVGTGETGGSGTSGSVGTIHIQQL